jgi:hypothetical protein
MIFEEGQRSFVTKISGIVSKAGAARGAFQHSTNLQTQRQLGHNELIEAHPLGLCLAGQGGVE